MHLLDEPEIAGGGHEPIAVARAWLAEFERIAMATVVATWGSSPVPVGSQLVVAPDERFEGPSPAVAWRPTCSSRRPA